MKYALGNMLNGGIQGLDPDAKAYIASVEAADAQSLEAGVKVAINNFVKGCKSDSIWDAIKASCILAGARTLSGALVPLRGTAPTNYNFVSGDYNRKTGLVGNGSTKYLDSNRNDNAEPQDSIHLACNATKLQTAGISGFYLGARTSTLSQTTIGRSGAIPNNLLVSSRSGVAAFAGTDLSTTTGFFGSSRNNSSDFIARGSGVNETIVASSISPLNKNVHVFQRNSDDAKIVTDARISFYSIGESLDLAALDSRVSTLMTSINSAIP
jgi:hypothetical protein